MFDDVISFAITLFLNIALSNVKEYSPKPVKVQHSACSKPWLGTRQGGWETEQVSLLRLQNSKPVHVWLRAWAGLFWGPAIWAFFHHNCGSVNFIQDQIVFWSGSHDPLLGDDFWSQAGSLSNCFWEPFSSNTKFTTFWIWIQERNKLEFRLKNWLG